MTKRILVIVLLCLSQAACVIWREGSNSGQGGGFYNGDKAPKNYPIDLTKISEPVPRHEVLSRTGNDPYTALGKKFYPAKSARGFVQTGIASWYGVKFHGRRTSSGEIYDMYKLTAAHPTLPLPSYIKVTHLDNGKSIIVKVNDRGPFLYNRIIDLSYAAAYRLGISNKGTGRVRISIITPLPEILVDRTKSHQRSTSFGTKEVRTPNEQYVIQVGVFADAHNAEQMSEFLKDKGFQITDWNYQKKQSIVHKVQVGPYFRRNEVEQAGRALQTILGSKVIILAVP